MRLSELIAGLGARNGPATVDVTDPSAALANDPEIRDLAYDSRAVGEGALFLCVSGLRSDGHEFADEAIRRGAVALAVERPLSLGVPEVLVPSVRDAMGPLAARFFGDPSSQLQVVGVTGTNGKTTTAFLVQQLMEAEGRSCGLLGTVKAVVAGRERPVVRTTPEAIDLQRDLRAMLDGGDRACAIEISSHALALGRASSIRCAAAIFTNLSRDHLDFHETMEDYFQAKRRLFVWNEGAPSAQGIVNVGDPYGMRLAEELGDARTFAVDRPADYSATAVSFDARGCRFTLHSPAGEHAVALGMPGLFNVANALGALAAVHALGGDLDRLIEALADRVRVPGRFEPVDEGQDFAVLVDYAHTPDSLANVLAAARELARREQPAGRVLCVFGAGGDRDRGKRPLMGEVAARMADVVLVTSDNPRSEDPRQIIAEVMTGATAGAQGPADGAVEAIGDRRAAIARAVGLARAGDVVVIAGKGHEQGQELADGVKLPFDDVTVAREALRSVGVAAAGLSR